MTMITKDDILKELKYYHHYSGFKYIARDKNGTLYLYRDEPHKKYDCWIDTPPSATNFLPHKWPF